MKMTFSFFLSIYLRCGAPASWAAPHTVVCLDTSLEQFVHLPTCLDNTLDLANCFCTYAKIANLSAVPGISDHDAITFHLDINRHSMPSVNNTKLLCTTKETLN